MREAAADIGAIKTAASIGYMFAIDPVTILSDPNITHWVVRLTAYEYMIDQIDKKKAPPTSHESR